MAQKKELSPVTQKLLKDIEYFCALFNLHPSRFGRVVFGDPKFVGDLRNGRSVTLLTLGRVAAFLEKYKLAKQLPLDRVRWKPGTAEML